MIKHLSYKKYLRTDIAGIFESRQIMDPHLEERELIAAVFPFKVSEHFLSLIDWANYQDDPLFQLAFPQPGMLTDDELLSLKKQQSDRDAFAKLVSDIRAKKNPAPSGQVKNKPLLFDFGTNTSMQLDGVQHKYDKTALYFDKKAQTCHAYCTYCFRFNQFVAKDKFLETDAQRLHQYLKQNQEISDLLITGGDPAVMRIDAWRDILLPLLQPEFNHIKNIRVGTKALTYHPYRFLTEPDADDLIALFKRMTDHGKHLAIMAHISHPNELGFVAKQAVKRLIQEAACTVRSQSPVMRHINGSGEIWAQKWEKELSFGIIPYYMFVARDTGPQSYYEIPLAECFKIYQSARERVSGLSHTARGPSMSADPGKVSVLGIETVQGEQVFVLKFLQARRTTWTSRVFFAKYDPKAVWLSDLKPAFGETEFFFEKEELAKTYQQAQGVDFKIQTKTTKIEV